MKILITGSDGFIGAHLCNLLGKDYNIYKICSPSNSSTDNNSFSIDLSNKKAIRSLINILSDQKFDAIIHLASKMASPNKTDDLRIIKDNITISENVATLIKVMKPEVFINFSSMAVYPNISGLFSENSLPNPQKNTDCIYGLSKYCSEVIFDFLLEREKIRIVHLRVSQVYGEGMRKDRIIPIMLKELNETNTITVFGNGQRESNFIEVKKLVKQTQFFLLNNLEGIYNIGDRNISYVDLAQELINEYGNNNSTINKLPEGNKEKFSLDISKLKSIYKD